MNGTKTIAVLMTVHNRRNITLKGLKTLFDAIANAGESCFFDVFMTDDGCTDGTREAVRKVFPSVHIVDGDGTLFWNQGMIKAWKAANDSGIEYDYYLWFNDDVDLYDNSLATMFNTMRSVEEISIISGAFKDCDGIVSYGGWVNGKLAQPKYPFVKVDKINGNLVLIPRQVYKRIGGLDKFFTHSYGDWEYGYRARKNGFSLYITSTYVGVCNRHDHQEKCFNPTNTLRQRWSYLLLPNGHPPFEVFYYGLKSEGIISAFRHIFGVICKTLFPSFFKV